MGEKCGENVVKNVADIRPAISREIGRKKFHKKSSANSTSQNSFTARLWELGGTKEKGRIHQKGESL